MTDLSQEDITLIVKALRGEALTLDRVEEYESWGNSHNCRKEAKIMRSLADRLSND